MVLFIRRGLLIYLAGIRTQDSPVETLARVPPLRAPWMLSRLNVNICCVTICSTNALEIPWLLIFGKGLLRKVFHSRKSGTIVDLGLLLHNVVSDQDNENEAYNNQYSNYLSFENLNNRTVDGGMSRQVPQETNVA